ncbi:hypothetical protein B9479_008177, partial [Cryptococcus floricola]
MHIRDTPTTVTREVVARPELVHPVKPILGTVNPISDPVNPTSTALEAITAPRRHKMAPTTLPPSFYNSFWSADYRHGLQKL